MKNIIVPIDFSIHSYNAFDYALNHAMALEADLQLIFVQRKRNESHPCDLQEEFNYAKKSFDKFIESRKDRLDGKVKVNYDIRQGRVYKEVVKYSQEFENSIIILSCFGNTGEDDTFIGSNALRISSFSKCPVILIRDNKYIKQVERIIMPLDMSLETQEKVPPTVSLAKKYNSMVHLIDISTEQVTDIRSKLRLDSNDVGHYLRRNNIAHDSELLIGKNIANVILKYAKKMDADLIVAMSEHTMSESSFVGPNALQLIIKSHIPVMIVPSKT